MKHKKDRKKADHGYMLCERCEDIVTRRSPLQRYCSPCSEIRDMERKKLHHLANGKLQYETKRTMLGGRGAELSAAEQLDIISSTPSMPPMHWYRRVGIPFSWAGSKNHIFSNTRQGHVFMRAEASYMRQLLTTELRAATVDAPVVQHKVWLDLFVQKPRQSGDAVNFVDMVCDAAKDALLVDDRWFCIRSVDWQIAKSDPKLFVGVGQDETEPVQACSSCGRLLAFDKFQRNRGLPNGIGRNCKECQAVTNSRRGKRRVAVPSDDKGGLFE